MKDLVLIFIIFNHLTKLLFCLHYCISMDCSLTMSVKRLDPKAYFTIKNMASQICCFYFLFSLQSSKKTVVLSALMHFKWLLPYYISEDIRSESLFYNQKYGQPNLLFFVVFIFYFYFARWVGEGGCDCDQMMMVNLSFVIVIIWSCCTGRMMTCFDKTIRGIVVWYHHMNSIVMCCWSAMKMILLYPLSMNRCLQERPVLCRN